MKRVICFMLCFVFLCSFGFFYSYAETQTNVTETNVRNLMGDVNCDKQINAVDALWVLKYAVGKMKLTEEQLVLADMSYHYYKTENHKGIDAKDALLILQYGSCSGPFKFHWPFGQN